MAIYRGPGGAGDAVADTTNQSEAAQVAAAAAQASANEAAASASEAEGYVSALDADVAAAETAATNATASASAASTSASNASTSATNAANSATAAGTSATNAANSATAAANSATAAGTSATNAANSASAADTSASNASTSATNAANSATSASNSATAAAASYDSFDDRYLGAKASAPATDNDGDALLTGALYYNTAVNQLYIWDGTQWDDAAFSVSGAVTSFNTRTGAVTLSSADVTTALGFTPVQTETDPVVGAITGIVKANGAGTIAAAVAGTDYQVPLTAGTDYLAPAAIGSTVLAYDSNLQSFVTAFTLPTTDGSNNQALTTNGSGTLAFASIAVAEIVTPTNVSPADLATGILDTPTLEGSPYYSLYGKTQKSSQWQISTDDTFATTDYDSGEVLGVGVTHVVPAGNLSVSTTYYWRVRYRDSDDVYSEYSTPTEFATAAAFNNFIATPTATPAIGGALEGGFHTGLIWNQVTQSATSTTIGTGSKTFTVTDAAPLFYSGQAVEIRSRANPATNRMIGTVTGSNGTTLTVNVTSVDGSGTLTDWSVMAKFRVIVAPKSSGESSSKQYKNANTAAPSATGTLTEGLKATLALVADGNSTVYPAAHFCNDLSIGGYSDWYLPARDELELIYRNLKPVTNNNYTTTDRPTGATPDYKNLGSLGDTANTHGLNNNSSPQGVAYTTTVPGQTSVAAFQSGGAEAMTFGSNYYWSSTEYSTTSAWRQDYDTSFPGRQFVGNKNGSRYVRAVRRSII